MLADIEPVITSASRNLQTIDTTCTAEVDDIYSTIGIIQIQLYVLESTKPEAKVIAAANPMALNRVICDRIFG